MLPLCFAMQNEDGITNQSYGDQKVAFKEKFPSSKMPVFFKKQVGLHIAFS